MKKLQFVMIIQAAIAAAVLLQGCASSASGMSFPRPVTRTSFDVYYGEVISTRVVEIEGESTELGRFGGAIVGAAIGRGDARGFSSSRRIESAVGSVGGAIAGAAIERSVNREDGIEILVLLDHNETIAVVQANDIEFLPGERVQVLVGRDGSTRIQSL